MMNISLEAGQSQSSHRKTATRNPFPFVFIYGPPGSGKSAIACKLAGMLHLPYLDLDQMVESSAGHSIAEIFSQSGESVFRKLESQVLGIAVSGPPAVVALGGGTLIDVHNRQVVEDCGKVVCLSAPVDVLVDRIAGGNNPRPLLNGHNGDGSSMHQRLVALLEDRHDHYASFPVQAGSLGASPTQVARQVQSQLGYFYLRGVNTYRDHGYPILVQPDGLAALSGYLRQLGLHGPIALVADGNVSRVYGEYTLDSLNHAGFSASLISFPPGEQHKNADTVSRLYQDFSSLGLERDSSVVGLGGGITSDLAGFAASTYLRGLHWVAVPTTLLAMVDASVGGKTGYDLPQGKNLVGNFSSPSLVLADPYTLGTLPHRELLAGLAEVVKTGLIADRDLFNLCSLGYHQISDHLDEVVRRSLAVKVRIVQADPFEQNQRAALNLGHTIGHALEAASGYQLLHGEAVSIGLVLEARLAEHIGLAKPGLALSISTCLAGLGLPTCIPAGITSHSIIQAIRMDKKRLEGGPRFSLPVRVGKVKLGVCVPDWEKWLSGRSLYGK